MKKEEEEEDGVESRLSSYLSMKSDQSKELPSDFNNEPGPSDTKHIGHMGWDPNTGFDLNNLDIKLKSMFIVWGISKAQLKNPEMSKIIHDFIEKKGGVEAVMQELRRHGPALPHVATVPIDNTLSHCGLVRKNTKAKGKKRRQTRRLTKTDIGTPPDFQHIGHVGLDPNTAFDLYNSDPEMKNLFDMCGISEAQLKDRDTSKLICDFIQKNGGVEAVKKELRSQVPPPPPSLGGPPPTSPHGIPHPPPPPSHDDPPPPPPPSHDDPPPPPPPSHDDPPPPPPPAHDDLPPPSGSGTLGAAAPADISLLNNLDPELKNLFDMCSISEAQLKDPETSKDDAGIVGAHGSDAEEAKAIPQ